MTEKFVTHITFNTGETHAEDAITADQIGSTILRLCEGPAAAMGIVKRAIIVDGGDQICVEIKGRTIVYPPQLALEQRSYRINQQRKARKEA